MSTQNTQTRFAGKVALITGGGTGIGRASAEAILNGGGRVAVTGRRSAPLESLAEAYPDRVLPITADVAKRGDSQRVIETVVERFGRLDILINNAAVLKMKPLVEYTDDDLDQVFAVNLTAPLRWIRDAVPHLQAHKGTVVNISSVMGQRPISEVAYSSSKAAVDHVSRVLAVELGPLGIRVNAVAPGVTVTDMAKDFIASPGAGQMKAMTPLGRFGEVDDIADVVAFLASDDAGWVTGQVVAASGGLAL